MKLNQTNYLKIKEKISTIVPNKGFIDIMMHNIYQDEDPSNYKLKFNLKAIIENFKELNSYKPPAKGNLYKGKRLVVVGERSDYATAKSFDSFNEIFHEFNKEKEVVLVKNAVTKNSSFFFNKTKKKKKSVIFFKIFNFKKKLEIS